MGTSEEGLTFIVLSYVDANAKRSNFRETDVMETSLADIDILEGDYGPQDFVSSIKFAEKLWSLLGFRGCQKF